MMTTAMFGISLMLWRATPSSQPWGLYPEMSPNCRPSLLCSVKSTKSAYEPGKVPAPHSWLTYGGYLPCLLLFPQEAPWQLVVPNDGSLTDSLLCPQGLSHSENSIDGFAARHIFKCQESIWQCWMFGGLLLGRLSAVPRYIIYSAATQGS